MYSEIKFHLTFMVDSAEGVCKCNLFTWNILDFKMIWFYFLEVTFVVWVVHLINFLKEFSLKVDGLACTQTFCHIGNGGISNTQTLLQAFLSQYWHTSFQLESELLMFIPLAYHPVIILHPVLLGKHLLAVQHLLWYKNTLRQTSSLIWFLISWNATSCASNHWNNASFLSKPLRSDVEEEISGIYWDK